MGSATCAAACPLSARTCSPSGCAISKLTASTPRAWPTRRSTVPLYELTGRGRSLNRRTALATWAAAPIRTPPRTQPRRARPRPAHHHRPRSATCRGHPCLLPGCGRDHGRDRGPDDHGLRKPVPAPTAIIASDVCTARAIVFGGHTPPTRDCPAYLDHGRQAERPSLRGHARPSGGGQHLARLSGGGQQRARAVRYAGIAYGA
jgi:hypothetical protein